MINILTSVSVPCTPNENIQATALALNEIYIAVALSDVSIHVFSAVDGSSKLSFYDPCGMAAWAIGLLDGNVVVGSTDGVLRVWGIDKGALLYAVDPAASLLQDSQTFRINHLHILPRRSECPSILAATVDGTIRRWVSGSETYACSFLNGHSGKISNIQSYNGGERFVSAAYDGSICAWDVDRGVILWTKITDKQVFSLAVGTRRVAVGREDGGIRILNLDDGYEIAAIDAHPKLINGLLFYQDHLISTSTDGFGKVWSIDTGKYKLEREMKLHDHAIVARCMLGPWLITGGKEGGSEDNACGIDSAVKAWRVDGVASQHVRQLGTQALMVWEVGSSKARGTVVLSFMKRGKPTLEIWEFPSTIL